MQAHMQSKQEEVNALIAMERLATAVVGLAAQRSHLRNDRQRAQRSSLVNQALQAYRQCAPLLTKPGAA